MKRVLPIALLALGLLGRETTAVDRVLSTTSRGPAGDTVITVPRDGRAAQVCSLLASYPRSETEPRAFEKGEVAGLCQPFMKRARKELDRCGDVKTDPYLSSSSPATASSSSHYTWSTRRELASQGKVNLYDPLYQHLIPQLQIRIDEIKRRAADTCCGPDSACRDAIERVDVSTCKPNPDWTVPDPCVFSGRFDMAGTEYASMYRRIYKMYPSASEAEIRGIAAANLGESAIRRIAQETEVRLRTREVHYPASGKIVLTSYFDSRLGLNAFEPTLQHEFGHACSIVKMQLAAVNGRSESSRQTALRAVQWIDRAKDRCSRQSEAPDAYADFFESIGESRELAACIYKLTDLNVRRAIDRPCENLCPGHYLEEAVGIAFSLLNGKVDGSAGAVFPNTCNHVRDGQHPMVSDIVDCMTQYSPRFRAKLQRAYSCGG